VKDWTSKRRCKWWWWRWWRRRWWTAMCDRWKWDCLTRVAKIGGGVRSIDKVQHTEKSECLSKRTG